MSWSTAAGAGTIREIVNSNPQLCHQIVDILKTAGVPSMTDAQLCKFHFDQLPASMTKGFAFPQWTELNAADPLETYKQMVLANWPTNQALGAPPQAFFRLLRGVYQNYEVLRRATDEHAIHFYTATVPARPWSGVSSEQSHMLKQLPANFHFVKMELDFCHNKSFDFGPVYAVSYRPDLKQPVDAVDLDNGVITLWHGSMLQIGTGTTQWFRLSNAYPLSIDVSVNLITWHSSTEYSNVFKQPIRAGFSYGPTVCAYSITK